MTKTLYILRPLLPLAPEFHTYDTVNGFVLRAKTEHAARSLACMNARDEGGEVWKDPSLTSCEELLPTGSTTIILRDFRAG